jgi:hypothetical protein
MGCICCEEEGTSSIHKLKGKEAVVIYKQCYDVLVKQVQDALLGITKIQNQCADVYGEGYGRYHDFDDERKGRKQ